MGDAQSDAELFREYDKRRDENNDGENGGKVETSAREPTTPKVQPNDLHRYDIYRGT